MFWAFFEGSYTCKKVEKRVNTVIGEEYTGDGRENAHNILVHRIAGVQRYISSFFPFYKYLIKPL